MERENFDQDEKGNDKWQTPRGRIPMPGRGAGLLAVAIKLRARRKYKTLLRRERRSVDWLRRMRNESPRMFHHWSVAGNRVG